MKDLKSPQPETEPQLPYYSFNPFFPDFWINNANNNNNMYTNFNLNYFT